jgi:uncharacterized RDD family membrane protein YckC
MTTPPVVPAGWFPDPERPQGQRYWDGGAWTEHRRPSPAPVDGYQAEPPTTPQSVTGVPAFGAPGFVPLTSLPAPPRGFAYAQSRPNELPRGMYYDPASGLVLPEGVQLANVGRRIGAFFLAILLYVLTLGIGYVIWGLIVWGRGQTPALQVLGMRCWRPETQRVAGWWWMALREIVGGFIESFFSFVSLIVSFVLMAAGRERKCIHDYIAGTVVLNDPNNVLIRPKGLHESPTQFPPLGPTNYPNTQQFGGDHVAVSSSSSRALKKVGLIVLGSVGICICIAVLAAALAPSPGQPYRPIGGVLGSLGLFASIWCIWLAFRTAISESKNRIRMRDKARRIAKRNPRLADELGIGRPDLRRNFNDGGLIDVNHVPEPYLLHLPGVDQDLASRIVGHRQSVGGFHTAGDLEVTLDVKPGTLDEARDLMIFRPLW